MNQDKYIQRLIDKIDHLQQKVKELQDYIKHELAEKYNGEEVD